MDTDEQDAAELLERYRRNNCDLAVALQDLRVELSTSKQQLLLKERELQRAQESIAHLRRDLTERDTQLHSWRSIFMDLVQTNTRKYTEVMAKIGLVTGPQPVAKPSNSNVRPVPRTPRMDALRRRRHSMDSPCKLSNVTEESIDNTSESSMSKTNITENKAARRRAQSPPRKLIIRSDNNIDAQRTDDRSAFSSNESLDSIDNKENAQVSASGRPSRRTAPKNLAEPKLGTKLRRN